MSRTATVYGAGVAGMATALRLRNQGFEVTVMEWTGSYGHPLGSAHHFGYRFELGPSMIMLPAVYRDLFIKTGAPLEEVVDLQPVDRAREFVFSDGSRLTVPGVGIPAFANAVSVMLGNESGTTWRSAMAAASQNWAAIRQDFLHAPVATRMEYLKILRRHRRLRRSLLFGSANALLRRFRNERLSQVAEYLLMAHDIQPSQQGELALVLPYVEQEFGLWHIEGGASAVADAIYRRCLERGVEFRFDVDVTDIDKVGTSVVVIEPDLGDERHDVAHVYAFLLCVLLTEEVTLEAHETVFLPPLGATTGIGPIAVTLGYPESSEQRLGRALRIAVLGSTAELATVSARKDFADGVLNELALRGLDVRAKVSDSHSYLPTLTVQGGNGFYRFARQSRPNRDERSGLYYVGGDAHPGGGAEFALMGAEIVADLVRADFPKSKSK